MLGCAAMSGTLDALAQLRSLRKLILGRTPFKGTLGFASSLKQLEVLKLVALSSIDGSVEPLAGCIRLRQLEFHVVPNISGSANCLGQLPLEKLELMVTAVKLEPPAGSSAPVAHC